MMVQTEEACCEDFSGFNCPFDIDDWNALEFLGIMC